MPSRYTLRKRWQPVRGGLINLFKYEDQVFRYENGHLLLRGDNGSGKSRVLALQLPFLLDGDLSPYRVEPDRDSAKKMEWHLLMDGKYDRRTGYTWIEFGREDEDGNEHWITLGCGMEAKKGGGALDRWFFVSPLRVGEDFALVENNTPLGKRHLSTFFDESNGSAGEFFTAKTRYRKAVDDALFRLGSRYDPLIDLLIQLRQPQLMRDMREDALSNALSEALPPVEERLVAEVAESFQGLDSDRQRTDEYRQMLESVETFRESYRRYLAVAVRRLCDVVRTGHSQFEHAARELRRIEEEAAENRKTLAEARTGRDEVSARLAGLSAKVGTLRESPEMRDKAELDRASTQADERRAEAGRAEAEAKAAADFFEKETRERQRRERYFAEERNTLTKAHRELARSHRPLAVRGETLFDVNSMELMAAKSETDRFVDTHRKNARHLRGRNEAVKAEKENERRVGEEWERARETLAEAGEKVAVDEERVAEKVGNFAAAVDSWEASLIELPLDQFPRDLDWKELLEAWLGDREDDFAFVRMLEEAYRAAMAVLERKRVESESEAGALGAELGDLVSERDRLREGKQPEPPVPRTRDPRPEDRDGSPFWRWFEFRPEIPADEHAGWEAAIESAGLLDAWIYPDGRIDTGEAADTFVGKLADAETGVDASLGAILQLAGEGENAAVSAILRTVGNHRGAARCWVARDGSWANGPHHGRWKKKDAEFLGHRAREAARRRRLAELDKLIAETERRLAGLEVDREKLAERTETLGRERASAPSEREAVDAVLRLEQSREILPRRKSALIEAEEACSAARRALDSVVAKRDEDAADLGMSDWAEPEELDKFLDLLVEFEKQAIAFWPTWRRVLDLEEELEAARRREADADEARRERESLLRERRERAESAASRAETLRANVGEAVEEILRRLGVAEAEEADARTERDERERIIREAEKREAVLAERQRSAGEARESAEATRNRAVDRMGDFVTHRLFEELDPASQPDRETFSATAAVELARRFEQELKEHPLADDHWNRLQTVIVERFNDFSDQLGRHGPFPRMERIDESSVCVVRSEFQNEERTVGELQNALGEELENRRRIFEEEERKVIENHLIGEAAVAVRDRIRAGDDWVRDVNGELSRVPTSSGIQLKFEWRLAEPDDLQLKSVRELFRKHAATWTIPEREEIGTFLQDRIRDSREEDDSRTWRDHLGHALDYRGWHRFGILRKQSGDENWKRLTRRTFGTGSGGEKALTLTVPQFAAAAAHYHSAHPHAPRLILLDEVFVGIDANTRSRLMSLLETFDLDYVMTSEREWGAFPTVSALAIYQLATRPGFNAVAVTRWVWNGKEKYRDPGADEEKSTDAIELGSGT